MPQAHPLQKPALPAVLLLAGVVACVSAACFTVPDQAPPRRPSAPPPPAPATPLPRPAAPPPPLDAGELSLGPALRACLPGFSAAQPDEAPDHLQLTRYPAATGRGILAISAVGRFDEASVELFAGQVRRLRLQLAPATRVLLQVFQEDENGTRTFLKRFDFN